MNTVIVVDDIFTEEYLEKLDELCKGDLLQLDSETGSHVGEYTDYEWQMIKNNICLLYTSPSPRDQRGSRMPSSA